MKTCCNSNIEHARIERELVQSYRLNICRQVNDALHHRRMLWLRTSVVLQFSDLPAALTESGCRYHVIEQVTRDILESDSTCLETFTVRRIERIAFVDGHNTMGATVVVRLRQTFEFDDLLWFIGITS